MRKKVDDNEILLKIEVGRNNKVTIISIHKMRRENEAQNEIYYNLITFALFLFFVRLLKQGVIKERKKSSQ
jgi:hypothetical protein